MKNLCYTTFLKNFHTKEERIEKLPLVGGLALIFSTGTYAKIGTGEFEKRWNLQKNIDSKFEHKKPTPWSVWHLLDNFVAGTICLKWSFDLTKIEVEKYFEQQSDKKSNLPLKAYFGPSQMQKL